jgi:3-oxoacyl-[acyl-carrier protein] reductase
VKKRTALITGGAKGIGRRSAYTLAELGHDLIINYRKSEQEAEYLAANLKKVYGINVWTIQGDVANPQACEQMIHKASHHVSSIDIVIHNAGPYIKERKTMEQYTLDEWLYLLNGNLTSVFYLTKLILPKMRENRWGRIITFGFDRVESAPGWIYRSAFAAAKTGLASLTKTLALEEAPNGITVNMICPGDIIGDWKEKSIDEAITYKDSSSPVGRPGTGEDISRVIAFLCDEKSSFITGSIIPVTGGKDVLGKVYHQQ